MIYVNCVFVIVKQMPFLSIITQKKKKKEIKNFVCACEQFVLRQNNISACTQENNNNNKNVEKLTHIYIYLILSI